MENKEEVVYKLLCMSCLCVGRSLQKIPDEKLQQYYLNTLKEVPLSSMTKECPSLCWECNALLKKLVSFREQAKDSYRILLAYTNENLQECLLPDVVRPPRLNVHTNDPISITPSDLDNEDRDPREVQLVYVKDEVKAEYDDKAIKEDMDLSEIDDLLPSDRSEDTVEMESEINSLIVKKKKMKRKTGSNVEDDMDFSEVDDLLLSFDSDDTVELESNIKSLLVRKEQKIKRTMENKTKSEKRTGKGVRKKKKYTASRSSKPKEKILKIELSYEEMVAEREKESKRESYVNAKYKCETCLVGFNYNSSYRSHVTSKHSSDIGEYVCPICKTVISSVDSFTAHYKRHMRRYECSICHKRTMDAKVMQQHYYSTHEISLKEYQCNLCGKISNSIDTHRYHRDSHKARVQCSECDKTFCHRAGLMNHRLAVHELHNKFPCTVCGKVFKWKTSLKRHLDKHEMTGKPSAGAAGAFCAPCGVSFTSTFSYHRHLKNSLKHVTQDQLKFICDHCNRRFSDKTKLRDHIEEKHLLRTYQCHICNKPSKNRVGLDQHIRNVHKGRPNNKMCHHCGKGFPTKFQLESHIRTHTGERPFICEYCPTTFSQQSNLYKHNRQVHLNMKTKRHGVCKKTSEGHRAEEATAEPYAVHYADRDFVM